MRLLDLCIKFIDFNHKWAIKHKRRSMLYIIHSMVDYVTKSVRGAYAQKIKKRIATNFTVQK